MIKIVNLIILVFFISGCARLSDNLFKKEDEKFDISAVSGNDGEIVLSWIQGDYTNTSGVSSPAGEYFRGFYVYRNSVSPYEEFRLVGIDAKPDTTGLLYYEEKYNKQGIKLQLLDNNLTNSGKGPGVFTDVNCIGGKVYFYRVASVYRKWNGSSFEGNLVEKKQSSWTAAICGSSNTQVSQPRNE
ncbi:MAG: hypothetical protein A2Y41_12560 [Spirochaetes bacterium GWB1_36_13]|nr:MAG: hypothetical protein A2Y41_12560 [Spirochaetes bacterium GWB1_36_13]